MLGAAAGVFEAGGVGDWVDGDDCTVGGAEVLELVELARSDEFSVGAESA